MPEFVQTRTGIRSTTHELDVEAISAKPNQKFALRFTDRRGAPSYLTGVWSTALAAAKERARVLILENKVARRTK